jgi:hypothetical protein
MSNTRLSNNQMVPRLIPNVATNIKIRDKQYIIGIVIADHLIMKIEPTLRMSCKPVKIKRNIRTISSGYCVLYCYKF